ncbi:2OG-Fe(II) oxygenase [Ramlibacter algicola]|uniref:2OG-Fe(II) oxygenase n=1 Tax=Ramlibacter algicola TaxID=2795217 RepID=A0A934PYX6_9BURK|nr:2OG-Fe(II) oxygenase [Ramlibacter algicola]MBK0391948.1 2OG-Fe(II) oxygenase [Ramlibacter algicola]
MKQLEDLLPLEKMDSLALRATEYQHAKPFPHIVFDDFLAPEIIAELVRDFPGPEDHAWLRYRAPAEKDKLQSTSELQMPPTVRGIINAFNSSTFVKFLEKLTGIEGIVPDPHLFGGGMHQTLPGGHLKVHIDYNFHAKWKLDRRLNVLLYLNEDWQEEWNGHLELWEGDRENLRERTHRILPLANRLVIFNTDERSWHGVPEPLLCPPGRTRKSIALYYYSNGRPEEERGDVHNTVFLARPGEKISTPIRAHLREWVPPALLKLARRGKPD